MSGFVNEFIKQLLLINIFDVLKPVNQIINKVLNTSLLNILFNHYITFATVGIILFAMGLPKSKVGKIIGKFLYKKVSYVVGIILNAI